MTRYFDIISDGNKGYLRDYKTSDDGRKEEHMSDKYVVSQEFMNELKEWHYADEFRVDTFELYRLRDIIVQWYKHDNFKEQNNRLIAIIRWVNGEDVFEVEKPKKWVVRSKECDEGGNYQYIKLGNFNMSFNRYKFENATKFDTKEEAQSWANAHQEVVSVEE